MKSHWGRGKAGELASECRNVRPLISNACLLCWQGVDYDEAAEAAGTALTHAATLFDTTRGGRLSTYVWPSIHRTLIKLVDQQSNVMRLPPRSRQRLRQLNETYHALTHALGRPPSMAEVAAEVCVALV